MTRFMRGEPDPVTVPFALAKDAEIGDLLATASSGGAGYKASEQTWDTDLATTRAAFVTRFVGVSNQAKEADEEALGGAAAPLRLVAHTAGVWCFETPAAGTYLLGTLVGPAKDTGNTLTDQTLEVVSSQAQAIGYCVGNFGVNPSEIDVRLLSAVCPAARQ